MLFKTRRFIYSTLLLLSAIALIVISSVSVASAQTTQTGSSPEEVAKASLAATVTKEAGANVPVFKDYLFKDYRGVQIGMSAEEVRAKLDRLKDGGPAQDFFVFSDRESAQIYYDKAEGHGYFG